MLGNRYEEIQVAVQSALEGRGGQPISEFDGL